MKIDASAIPNDAWCQLKWDNWNGEDFIRLHGLLALNADRKVCVDKLFLVGGFKHGFYFPFHIWDNIPPIDELIFFKIVKT